MDIEKFLFGIAVGIILGGLIQSFSSRNDCLEPVAYMESKYNVQFMERRAYVSVSSKGEDSYRGKNGSRVLETSLIGGPWENQ